jgi:hypothetical protein
VLIVPTSLLRAVLTGTYARCLGGPDSVCLHPSPWIVADVRGFLGFFSRRVRNERIYRWARVALGRED